MKIHVAKKAKDAYQHGDLREALIDAGVKLLMEGGLDKLSLRAAAQLAGVSHTAPYRHYRDKDALVAAIAERGFGLLAAATRAEIERSGARKALRKLVALGVGYVEFGIEHPAYLQLIFGGVMAKPEVPPSLRAAGRDSYQVLREVVAAGIASGELRKADVDDVALACWSLVHGLTMLIIHGSVVRTKSSVLERVLAERIVLQLGAGIAG
jgi:AcrR family transcriptional regulator